MPKILRPRYENEELEEAYQQYRRETQELIEKHESEQALLDAEKKAFWRSWVPVFGAVWYLRQRLNGFYSWHPWWLVIGLLWSNITSAYLPIVLWGIWE